MFKPGDLVRLKRGYDDSLVAKAGATARVIETDCYLSIHGWFGSPTREHIRIEWVRDGQDHGQANGLYYPEDFAKVYEGMERQKRRKRK